MLAATYKNTQKTAIYELNNFSLNIITAIKSRRNDMGEASSTHWRDENKYGVRTWTGFIWLKKSPVVGFREYLRVL
jgi:hypothetical protein